MGWGVPVSVGLLMMIQSHQLNSLLYQGICECLQTASSLEEPSPKNAQQSNSISKLHFNQFNPPTLKEILNKKCLLDFYFSNR